MNRKERNEFEKKTKESEYGKKIESLADKISYAMDEMNQGYIFSVIPNRHDTRCHFGSFKISSKNFEGFWASLVTIIQDIQRNIPEDQLRDFRKGFLPMVYLVTQNCFPMIHLEGAFYDELQDYEDEGDNDNEN